VGAGEIGGEGS